MLTTVPSRSLRLGRLTLHQTLDSSASLTKGHVVQIDQTDLENGSFLMGQLFQLKVWLQHFTETEEMMEQSTWTESILVSWCQLDYSVVKCLMLLVLYRDTVLILVSWKWILYSNWSPFLLWNSESSISVRITGRGATPALGQSYSLTCEVSGASGPVTAYQWRKDGAAVSTGPTLSFSSLTLSDASQYTCQVSVDEVMVNSPPQNIRLTS